MARGSRKRRRLRPRRGRRLDRQRDGRRSPEPAAEPLGEPAGLRGHPGRDLGQRRLAERAPRAGRHRLCPAVPAPRTAVADREDGHPGPASPPGGAPLPGGRAQEPGRPLLRQGTAVRDRRRRSRDGGGGDGERHPGGAAAPPGGGGGAGDGGWLRPDHGDHRHRAGPDPRPRQPGGHLQARPRHRRRLHGHVLRHRQRQPPLVAPGQQDQGQRPGGDGGAAHGGRGHPLHPAGRQPHDRPREAGGVLGHGVGRPGDRSAGAGAGLGGAAAGGAAGARAETGTRIAGVGD